MKYSLDELISRLRVGGEAPTQHQAADAIEALVRERDALKAALANSGNRHEYTAPPGMVFVPKEALAERDALLGALSAIVESVPYGQSHEATFVRARAAIDAARKPG